MVELVSLSHLRHNMVQRAKGGEHESFGGVIRVTSLGDCFA